MFFEKLFCMVKMSDLEIAKKIVTRYMYTNNRVTALLQFNLKPYNDEKEEKGRISDEKCVQIFIEKLLKSFTLKTEKNEIYVSFQKAAPNFYFTRNTQESSVICLYVNSFVRELKKHINFEIIHYLSTPMESI